MSEEKLVAAGKLAVIGGILIFVWGLFYFLMSMKPIYAPLPGDSSERVLFSIMLLVSGVVAGIVVIFGGFKMYHNPRRHVAWGIVTLAFSILSVLTFGGLFGGLLFGAIGGALGIAWKPSGSLMSRGISRTCPSCGKNLSDLPEDTVMCPYCAKSLKLMASNEEKLLRKYKTSYPHNPSGVLEFHISRRMREGKTREQAVSELLNERA